jgi:hypothetical protein
MRLLPPGVADQDVQAAETFDRACNQVLTELLVPQSPGMATATRPSA